MLLRITPDFFGDQTVRNNLILHYKAIDRVDFVVNRLFFKRLGYARED